MAKEERWDVEVSQEYDYLNEVNNLKDFTNILNSYLGNPQTFLAIMAHAPDTINGQFRVTKQGETIEQYFGYSDRAERTMDICT